MTNIFYQLKESAEISVKIYDSSGGLVIILEEDIPRTASDQPYGPLVWDGRNGNGDIVANNVYFCVLEIGTEQQIVRKIAVLR